MSFRVGDRVRAVGGARLHQVGEVVETNPRGISTHIRVKFDGARVSTLKNVYNVAHEMPEHLLMDDGL